MITSNPDVDARPLHRQIGEAPIERLSAVPPRFPERRRNGRTFARVEDQRGADADENRQTGRVPFNWNRQYFLPRFND